MLPLKGRNWYHEPQRGKRTGKQLFPVATVLNGKRVARA